MHETKGIVHRDLKANNMIIGSKLNVMVVDFGYAACKSCRDISQMKDYKGSRTYMAPEILERRTYNGR